LKTKNSNLTKQTLFGFFWLACGKASKALLQLIILGVLARLLSPTEFGLMALALIVISFSDIFTDLGFGPALTQKRELSDIDIQTSFTFSVLFGVFLLVGIWFSAPLIASFFNSEKLIPILRAISPVLFFGSVSSTPMGLMDRHMQYKESSLIQVISYIIGYGAVGIVFAAMDYGVWALVFAVIGQSFLSTILYFKYSKLSLKFSLDKASFKELMVFGGGYSLSKIFTYFGNKGEKIVVGRLLGIDALGLYERGYQLVKFIAGLVGEIIDKVLFAPIAKKQDDRELVGKIFLELTYITCTILLPASFFIYNNADSIVNIILGDKWDATIEIVQIMALSLFFLVSTRIGSTLAKSLGDVYSRALRTLTFAIFVMLGAYFAAEWGINGVATAVTGAIAINYILAFSQTKKLTKVGIFQFLEAHLLGIGLSVLYQLLFFVASNFLYDHIESHLIKITMSIVLMVTVYFVGYLLDYKKVVKKYFKIIFKK